MKPEYIDNFLGNKEFDDLQSLLISEKFPWAYTDVIDVFGAEDEKDKFQFSHVFYMDNCPHGYCEKLNPIFEILEVISLYRVKANLLTKTPNIIENKFHTDPFGMSEEQLQQWTTSIFYINTNNGYTKFEDGTKVESVANRMVFFPADMKHTGTSCSDEKVRIVINFNYFK